MSLSAPDLPAVFAPVRLERGLAALSAAQHDLDELGQIADGTLYWSDDDTRLDIGVVLEPEDVDVADLRRVGEIALTDGLAAQLPPQIPIQIGESTIVCDGTALGRIKIDAIDPEARFCLMQIQLTISAEEEGEVCLRGCGTGDLPMYDLLTSTARQLVRWIAVLEDNGSKRIEDAWTARRFDGKHL